ncbi:MAG: polyprenyl synthetase family protein, partial [Hamadaea sp.]|nr:polyprenyl synthetase family protein [Hamadaea sp.]
HDDVMDGDANRRHRATVWKVFGVPQAVLIGDALLGRAFEVLAEEMRDPLAARTLAAAVGDLLHGQGDDVAFETRDDVSLTDCVAMAGRKTGALLACACALGALAGGGTPEQIGRLRAFGADVGLAFQLVDDILGIWGDPRVTGKPVHSDLRSRKRSLPVVAALASGHPSVKLLSQVYSQRSDLDDATVAQLAEVVERAGGREWCVAQARMLIGRAVEGLAADPTLTRTAELAGLARLLIERDR